MRRALLLSCLSLPLLARLPAVAQEADSALAATDAAVARLAERLARLGEDGLDPRHYAVPEMASAAMDPAAFRVGTLRSAQAALADLLLGRVNGLRGRADLRRSPDRVPLGAWLAELAASPEPAQVIERAATLHPDASPIKALLAAYRAVAAAGGWPRITRDTRRTLEPGSTDAARVPQLRARLAVYDPALAEGATATSPVYDGRLIAAVRAFQASEGLEVDGRVGAVTWGVLNTPVESKIAQLVVALDMRRAQPAPSAERRIEVNIPHFRLHLLEGSRVVQDMAVIVGRVDRQTPVLNIRMVAVRFNPPWGVPTRNAREDILPRLRANPEAVRARGFRIFRRIDGEIVEVDPATVDWTAYDRNRFPYFIRQDAGDANALGRIMFVTPNAEDIFLHDTPDRQLFRRGQRAFSSGCIRVERPMELLFEALSGTSGWDQARVGQVLESRRTVNVPIARPIPVRLHYTTVIVEGGRVIMRPDIYGLDAEYARALDRTASPRIASLEGGVARGSGAR